MLLSCFTAKSSYPAWKNGLPFSETCFDTLPVPKDEFTLTAGRGNIPMTDIAMSQVRVHPISAVIPYADE